MAPTSNSDNEEKSSRQESGSSRRVPAYIAILFVLMFGYVTKPYWPYLFFLATKPFAPAPLPGTNSISNLKVHQDAKERWIATFDYFYTGQPKYASIQIALQTDDGAKSDDHTSGGKPPLITAFATAKRGAQKAELEIHRPPGTDETTTTQVIAQLSGSGVTSARQSIAQPIHWPDWFTWAEAQKNAQMTDEQILSDSSDLIDRGDESSLNEAKQKLESLINRNSKFSPAYVELARIAMKTNWGPEGLHQAENLLQSSLQIQPDNADAKILLGYVYTHQKRFLPAEALFTEAAASNPPDLWLWTNWGELFLMQGKTDSAVEKYREAVTRPRSKRTYDYARVNAYAHLLDILERRNDLDGMEVLEKQRAAEFGEKTCYNAEYALFMLQKRGNIDTAIDLAKQSAGDTCRPELAHAALGLAYYAAWADPNHKEQNEALNQARVFLPPGAHTLFLLAQSDITIKAAQKLVTGGESVDGMDNDNFNALAYALHEKDAQAIRRLLKLGAHPEIAVGPQNVPIALIPVLEADFDEIRIMQKAGVNYAKLTYEGMTAMDYAKRTGNKKLMDTLDPKLHSL